MKILNILLLYKKEITEHGFNLLVAQKNWHNKIISVWKFKLNE